MLKFDEIPDFYGISILNFKHPTVSQSHYFPLHSSRGLLSTMGMILLFKVLRNMREATWTDGWTEVEEVTEIEEVINKRKKPLCLVVNKHLEIFILRGDPKTQVLLVRDFYSHRSRVQADGTSPPLHGCGGETLKVFRLLMFHNGLSSVYGLSFVGQEMTSLVENYYFSLDNASLPTGGLQFQSKHFNTTLYMGYR